MTDDNGDHGYSNRTMGARALKIGLVLLALGAALLQQPEKLLRQLQVDREMSIQVGNITHAVAAAKASFQPHDAEKDDNRDRTAILWVCRYLDACGAARLRHLIATAGAAKNSSTTTTDSSVPPSKSPRDVWVLHSHKSLAPDTVEYQNSVRYLQELEQYASHHVGTRLYSMQQTLKPSVGFDDERAGPSKSAFLYFMVLMQYGWAWHIEDDIFYTGRWEEIFSEDYHRNDIDINAQNATEIGRNIDQQSTTAVTPEPPYDVIATGHPESPDWYWFRYQPCEITIPGKLQGRCTDVAPNMTRWGILRLSQRFARTLLTNVLTGHVVGHHEAVVASVCQVYNYSCTVDYLQPRVGNFLTAGWGDWANSATQFLERHAPIQPGKIYHPVKCAAYPSANVSKLTQHLAY
jgi:hypothetical protein